MAEDSAAMAADGGRFQCVTKLSWLVQWNTITPAPHRPFPTTNAALRVFFFEFLMLIRPRLCENRGSKN